MKLWLKVKRPSEGLSYSDIALSNYSDDIEVLVTASKIKQSLSNHQIIKLYLLFIVNVNITRMPWT